MACWWKRLPSPVFVELPVCPLSCQRASAASDYHLLVFFFPFFFLPVFTTSSSLSCWFSVGSTSDKETGIQRRSCLRWESSTKTLMRKIQAHGFLYLVVIAWLRSSLCLQRRSMWWWRAAKINHNGAGFFLFSLTARLPLLCADASSFKPMQCAYPVGLNHKLNTSLGLWVFLDVVNDRG